MTKTFKNLEEIAKYYNEDTCTYVFKEGGSYIDRVVFKFELEVEANIDANIIEALDIKAWDINAYSVYASDMNVRDIIATEIKADNIYAFDVNVDWLIAKDVDVRDAKIDNLVCDNLIVNNIIAKDISAGRINYWALCFAYRSIKCKSIHGRRENAVHIALDKGVKVAL